MQGVDPEAEPHDPERIGHVLHEGQVGVELVTRLVDRAQRRARQLELSTGLEGDARPVLREGNDVLALEDALPAVLSSDSIEDSADAAFAVVRNGSPLGRVQSDFLVLRTDEPTLGRLFAGAHVREKIVLRSDRNVEGRRRGGVVRHTGFTTTAAVGVAG